MTFSLPIPIAEQGKSRKAKLEWVDGSTLAHYQPSPNPLPPSGRASKLSVPPPKRKSLEFQIEIFHQKDDKTKDSKEDADINKKLPNEKSRMAIYWSQINAERESDPEYYLLVSQQQY